MQGWIGPDSSAIPHGPSQIRECNRELFPLPLVEGPTTPSGKLSRKCRQRAGRRKHFGEEVNRTLGSLNLMYGADQGGSKAQRAAFSRPSLGQLECLEFVEHAVETLGAPPDLSGPKALEELRVSVGYAELPTACPLGSFDPDLVALPSEGMRPVPLEKLWGEGGRLMVEEFHQERLVGPDVAKTRLDESGVGRCYQDPEFNNPVTFAAFVSKLVSLNLVEVSLQPAVEQVGLFFVKKKVGKLRLIMDCRRSNCHFEEPEPVQLATGEAMSRMELPEGKPLFTASADLQNAFYTMSMPELLRPYFGLRRCRAADLGLKEVDGVKLKPQDWVYPRVSVIPMGWKWALFFCQRVNERICETAGLEPSSRLRDGRATQDQELWHVQYVDNLHIFGTDRQLVEQQFWKAVGALRDAGLTVHEIEFDEGESKVLGWEIGKDGKLRPGKKRIWRLRLGIRELLRRGQASGQQLERLVGHIIFVSLCKRETLATLGEIYSFIRRHYTSVVPLWRSVRRELVKWEGISPLISCDLMRPWDTTIYAVDASEWGLGVVRSQITQSEVKHLGRYTERWRFKDDEARDARAFALAEDERLEELSKGRVDRSQHTPKNFSSVPFTTVARDWQVVGRHRWRKLDSMPVYEARASLYAIKHCVRNKSSFGKKHLVLTDSMTAAVSFDKGRSHSFKLRRVLEQAGAISLCTGCLFKTRWIPTEWNPADALSRGKWTPSLPVRHFNDSSTLGVDSNLDEAPGTGKETIQETSSHSSTSSRREETFNMGHRAGAGTCQQKAAASFSKKDSGGKQSKQDLEKQFSGARDFGEVPASLACVQGLVQPSSSRGVVASRAGPSVKPIPGGALFSRRRPECGKLRHGCSYVPCSGLQVNEGTSQESAEHARMAKTLPTSQSTSSSIRGSLPSSSGGGKARSVGVGAGNVGDFSHVSPTRGALPSSSSRHRGACAKGGQGISQLQSFTASRGDRHTLKDVSVGRDAINGSSSFEISGACNEEAPSIGKPQEGRKSLCGDSGTTQQLCVGALGRVGAETSRPASPLQVSTRRGILRGGKSFEEPRVDSGPRAMADSQESKKLREGRSAATVVCQSFKSNSKKVRGSKKGHRKNLPFQL